MTFGVEIEDVVASTVLDLTGTNTDDNLRVAAEDEWVPAAFNPDEQEITETIPMLAVGTTAQVRAAIRDLDRLIEKGRLWSADRTRMDDVVLRYKEESNQYVERPILGGRLIPKEFTGSHIYLDGGADTTVKFDLEIKTVPHFFDDEGSSLSTGSIDRFGGSANLTLTKGSRPALITNMETTPELSFISHAWIGLREEREGLTDFTPRILTGDLGNYFNGASSVVGNTWTYGTNYTLIDFSAGGDSLQKRWEGNLLDLGLTNYEDMNGKYLVIVRAAMTAAAKKAGVQLAWGYPNDNFTYNSEVEVTHYDASSSEVWGSYPLGYIQIPPWPAIEGSHRDSRNFQLEIYAERLVGSGSDDLAIDAIALIPTDHLFTCKPGNTQDIRKLFVATRKDWQSFSYGLASGVTVPKVGYPQTYQDWNLPVGTFKVVVVTDAIDGTGGIIYSPGPTVGDLGYQFFYAATSAFPWELE